MRSYIDFLQKIFVVKVLEHIEPSGKIMPRKNKKIHIIDPFLYTTISRWTREEVAVEQKVESLVMSHLSHIGPVYYWRNKTEIDIVLRRDYKLIGFEVKWALKPKTKKKPIRTITLNREEIPLFLATLDIKGIHKE